MTCDNSKNFFSLDNTAGCYFHIVKTAQTSPYLYRAYRREPRWSVFTDYYSKIDYASTPKSNLYSMLYTHSSNLQLILAGMGSSQRTKLDRSNRGTTYMTGVSEAGISQRIFLQNVI